MSIRAFTTAQKQQLVYSIEKELNQHLYPEMVKALQEVIAENTLLTLGIQGKPLPLMSKGVLYHPQYIKPLTYLNETTLPLHKNAASDFSKFLTEYRKPLVDFSVFRNMLIKALTIADNFYDIHLLTTIPKSSIANPMLNTEPSRFVTEDVLKEFHIKHAKSIELVEFYKTFNQLFGDIDTSEDE